APLAEPWRRLLGTDGRGLAVEAGRHDGLQPVVGAQAIQRAVTALGIPAALGLPADVGYNDRTIIVPADLRVVKLVAGRNDFAAGIALFPHLHAELAVGAQPGVIGRGHLCRLPAAPGVRAANGFDIETVELDGGAGHDAFALARRHVGA